jgi:hypothetical protein
LFLALIDRHKRGLSLFNVVDLERGY